jgi:hypothetical protein
VNDPGRRDRRGLEREDRIALGVIGLAGAVVVIGCLLAARWLLAGVTGVIDLETGGVGWRDAFVAGIVASVGFVLVFALFAGDGVVGELPTMLAGFFVMLAFFTVSIALIL